MNTRGIDKNDLVLGSCQDPENSMTLVCTPPPRLPKSTTTTARAEVCAEAVPVATAPVATNSAESATTRAVRRVRIVVTR